MKQANSLMYKQAKTTTLKVLEKLEEFSFALSRELAH